MGTSTTGGGGASSFGEFTQIVSPGILIALSCFAVPELEENFRTYAVIGVKTPDERLSGRLVQLAAGYIREEQALTWTGFYPLQSGDEIYMFLRGNLNPVFSLVDRRLTAETTLISGVTLGQLLRATN